MDLFLEYPKSSMIDRLTRLRTNTLFWKAVVDPANKSNPVNAGGFVVGAADLQGLSTTPASLAGWRVWAFHSWTKSRHTVQSITNASVGGANSALLKFEQETDFPYGQFTYCSLQRYYIEGARELLNRQLSEVRGDFLILPAANSLPGNASCALGGCKLVMARVMVEAAAAAGAEIGLPVVADLFATTDGVATGARCPRSVSPRLAERPWSAEVLKGNGGFDRFGHRFDCRDTRGSPPLSGDGPPTLSFTGLTLQGTATTCIRGSSCDGDIASTTTTAAINVVRAAGLVISDCTVKALGGWGVLVSLSSGTQITNLTVWEVGAGGIRVTESPTARAIPSSINNCTVGQFGQTIPSGVGVGITGANITVEGCDISGGYFNGFVASQLNGVSSGSALRTSTIHDIGHTDDDGICDFGAIHIGGAGAASPMFIHDNVFANVSAFQNGGEGIYMDVSATGFDIRRNLVYGTQSSPLYWHVNPFVPMLRTAEPVVLDNNFFIASGKPNNYYLTHSGPMISWYAYTAANITRNIFFIAKTAQPSPGNTGSVYWGRACAEIENPSVVGQPCTNKYADSFGPVASSLNLYWNASSGQPVSATFPDGGGLLSWQTTDGANGTMHEAGSISKDPLFASVDGFDFHLVPTSPALLELGIQQLE